MQESKKSNRWLFVDLFRFSAVILMIQGHAFQALLSVEYAQSSWFVYHSFWHGFTAPMFMFASGIAFGIATLRSWKKHLKWGEVVKNRLIRYSSLLLIGYFLHLPYFSWSKIRANVSVELLENILSFDALHLIGISLLFLQLMVFIFKRKSTLLGLVGVTAAVILILAPTIWNSGENWPVAIESSLTAGTGSLFPIFPWAVYVLVGFMTACFLKPEENALPSASSLLKLVWFGIGLVIFSGLISILDESYLGYFIEMHWNVNPLVVIFKTGSLLAFLSLLFYLSYRRSGRPLSSSRAVKLIQKAANQTLAIYVLHLMIIYGSPINVGVRYFIGSKTHSLIFTSLFTLVLIILMILFALGWEAMRKSKLIPDRKIKLALTVVLLVAFLTRTF